MTNGLVALACGSMLDRSHFEALDANDPLGHLRERFDLPSDLIYLDGNSLGPLPSHVPEVLSGVVTHEWGRDLIRSWNINDWWTLAQRTGDRIAPLIGAPPGSVIVGDTTTVSLFKLISAARKLRPERSVVLTDTGNFPTDLYTLGALTADSELRMVAPEKVIDSIDEDVAVVALTHVDYRTGRRHDMKALTGLAHEVGALIIWDLSHSAGAMDLDLSVADMAVGCGYKYLNGGPGAPAFSYVRPDHHESFENPIPGWWGHADPFAMEPRFEPAEGIRRLAVGTQPIISMAALHAALEVFADVEMTEVRTKSELLVSDFISLADQRLSEFGLATPRESKGRGSHASLSHPEAAGIMAALVARGVIGDVRPPDLLRFGFAPTFVRHVDVFDAVEILADVMAGNGWRQVPSVSGPVT